jgi:hypothetical protein
MAAQRLTGVAPAGQPHQVRLGVTGGIGLGDHGVLGLEQDSPVGVGKQ